MTSFSIAIEIPLAKCGPINATERETTFNPDSCGEECGSSPLSTTSFYCEKGEKCCPSGAFTEECASVCGPYDLEGTTLCNFINMQFMLKMQFKNKLYVLMLIFHFLFNRGIWIL